MAGEEGLSTLLVRLAEDDEFLLCKRKRLCYTQPRADDWFALFLGSSAVEHPTVNRMVAGSNPARGAKIPLNVSDLRLRPYVVRDVVCVVPQH